MAKFYGAVGFVKSVEEPEGSGVWVEKAEERNYAGDISQYSSRWSNASKTNDDISISTTISVIADPFFYSNIGFVRYVVLMDSKWKVTNITPSYPRLTLEIGELYNG